MENESYFLQDFDKTFGTYRVQDEDIHPEFKVKKPHHALTETQYFTFSIPEVNIHAFLYLWYHPNLGVVGGGPIVFQGVKSIALAAELIDFRGYLPESQLGGTFCNYRLESGYSVEMLSPGTVFRVRYDDPARHNRFDVMLSAVAEPMVWPGSRHFEQTMRAQGELTLRGNHHKIDGFGIRDRSWGETRLETPMPGPPASWITGTFDEDFSFNITAFDHPDRDPLWKDRFANEMPTKLDKFGWMIVDGQPVVIESTRKLVHYNRETLLHERIDIEIRDVRGRTFEISGQVTAAVPLNTWTNVRVPICLTRWECGGRVGWGEVQEAQWNDFLEAHYARTQIQRTGT
ncbi:MAG: hypothetical protein IT550_14000 [Novosphingobium sp.]|jgi:hypothetical protein|nr:hypothetical protein [Novosphingobium sp.]